MYYFFWCVSRVWSVKNKEGIFCVYYFGFVLGWVIFNGILLLYVIIWFLVNIIICKFMYYYMVNWWVCVIS